ncbi:MAG: hypothetical protein IJW82_05230 [Clostridia bacterium]|nr:hypothetical protein [Clostridia bacterium]
MSLEERIKNMLISDKHFDTRDLIKVLRTDLYDLLVNYFDITPQDIMLEMKVDEFGIYDFRLQVKSERIKIFGSQIN